MILDKYSELTLMLFFFIVSVIMDHNKSKQSALKNSMVHLIELMNFFKEQIHFQSDGMRYGFNDICVEAGDLSLKQTKYSLKIENFKEPVLITRIKNIDEKPKVLSHENLEIDKNKINKAVYRFLSGIFDIKTDSSGTSNLTYRFKCSLDDPTYKKYFINGDSKLNFQSLSSKDIYYCCMLFLIFKQIITTLHVDENSNYIKEFVEKQLTVNGYKKKSHNRSSYKKINLHKILRRVGMEIKVKKFFYYNNKFQPQFYPQKKDSLLYLENEEYQMQLQTTYIFEYLIDFIESAIQLRYAIDNTRRYMHNDELLRLSIKQFSVDDIFNLQHKNILIFIFNVFFNYLYAYETEKIIVCTYCGNLYPEIKKNQRKYCEGSHCRQKKNNKKLKDKYEDILKKSKICRALQKQYINNKNSRLELDDSKDLILIEKYCEGCIKKSCIDENFQFPKSGGCFVIPFLSANIETISPSEDLISKFNDLPEEIKKKFIKTKKEKEVTLNDLLEQVLNSEENKK